MIYLETFNLLNEEHNEWHSAMQSEITSPYSLFNLLSYEGGVDVWAAVLMKIRETVIWVNACSIHNDTSGFGDDAALLRPENWVESDESQSPNAANVFLVNCEF